MDVFIGNLPGTATLLALGSFLDGIEVKPDFQCHEGRDKNNRNYHYFVASTRSRSEGLALIARLNGTVFGGHTIEAREYQRPPSCPEWPVGERRVSVL